MPLSIVHTTRYRYTEPLLHSVQTLHLWPESGPLQTVRHWQIVAPVAVYEHPPTQGNRTHGLSFTAPASAGVRELAITARGEVEPLGGHRFDDTGPLPPAFFRGASTHLAEPHPRMTAWARATLPDLPAVPDEAAALALAAAVADRVRYRPGNTQVDTTALEAFDWELGVCQDQAHVMAAVGRGLGWAVRYVSGYFFAQDEPELASHAWVDVCLDESRHHWMSVDVTHRAPTDRRHVRLAAARDYAGCLPVKGLRRGGGEESLDVQIRIQAA